mgnify:FL=1
MKMKNILYITDDYLYLKNKKNKDIIKYKVSKNIIESGKIVNIIKFNKLYEKMLSDNHLNNTLFGETIKIIVTPNYKSADITLLKNIFNCFNYRKVIVDYITKNYKLNDNNCYINIISNTIFITMLNEYKKINTITILSSNFKNTLDLCKYIKYIVLDKEIYLLGSGELLTEIFNLFEDTFSNKTFIFSNHDTYILTKFI